MSKAHPAARPGTAVTPTLPAPNQASSARSSRSAVSAAVASISNSTSVLPSIDSLTRLPVVVCGWIKVSRWTSATGRSMGSSGIASVSTSPTPSRN